jgi:hypothetical protein
MDEETPSARALLPCLLPFDTLKKIRDQNLLVLEQVDTFKQLWLQKKAEEEELFLFKEYRLYGKSQSLEEFLDLFLLDNDEYDANRVIWIPDSDGFVCIKRVQRDILPRAYLSRRSLGGTRPEGSYSA